MIPAVGNSLDTCTLGLKQRRIPSVWRLHRSSEIFRFPGISGLESDSRDSDGPNTRIMEASPPPRVSASSHTSVWRGEAL